MHAEHQVTFIVSRLLERLNTVARLADTRLDYRELALGPLLRSAQGECQLIQVVWASLVCFAFIHEYPFIEAAEQVEEQPSLLLVKRGNEFFPQIHLNLTHLRELGPRPLC